MVRAELGPDASVLHTRTIASSIVGWLGGETLEVTASDEVDVPSRLPVEAERRTTIPSADLSDYRRQLRQNLRAVVASETSLVERLSQECLITH